MKKYQAINKTINHKRLQKKLSLKAAAKELGISSLRLKLIEEGYLRVPKTKEENFVKFYKLDKNIFKNNNYYNEPLTSDVDNEEDLKKFRKKFSSKVFRIVSLAILLISLGTLSFGLYASNRIYVEPRFVWNETFTQFDNAVRAHHTDKEYDLLMLDDSYLITGVDTTNDAEVTLHYLNSEHFAKDTYFIAHYPYLYPLSVDYNIEYFISAYNNRLFAIAHYKGSDNDGHALTADCSCYISENGERNVRPFYYQIDQGPYQFADEHSFIYQDVKNKINNTLPNCLTIIDQQILHYQDANFGYQNTISLLEDVRGMSKIYITYSTFGFYFTLISAIVLAVVSTLFLLSFLFRPKPAAIKEKKPTRLPHVKFNIADVSLPTRELPSDIRMPLFVPECFIRVVGLFLILAFGICLNLSLFWETSADFELLKPNIDLTYSLSANFLTAGATLLFFLKLDIKHKQTPNTIVSDIFLLFMGGLIFYLIQIILYSAFTREGNVYSAIFNLISTFIPGNIIWNLMLYSCLFLFLFVTPKNMNQKPYRLLIFRLCSLIPTLLLLFAFIFDKLIKPYMATPYFISCIFFTKGLAVTIFAIAYLYALYFIRLYYRFRFGNAAADIYFTSRRYLLMRNIAACTILLVIGGVDIYCKYRMPNNSFGLGNNIIFLALIPLILFYHPHIGKRNAKWDKIFTILFIGFFVIGIMSAVVKLFQFIDLSPIEELIS